MLPSIRLSTYGEKANSNPPSSAGHHLRTTYRQRTNALHPASAGVSRQSTLYETIGPQIRVIGYTSQAASGMLAVQARLTPEGAQMTLVKKGLTPCEIAYAHQAMNQMYS